MRWAYGIYGQLLGYDISLDIVIVYMQAYDLCRRVSTIKLCEKEQKRRNRFTLDGSDVPAQPCQGGHASYHTFLSFHEDQAE